MPGHSIPRHELPRAAVPAGMDANPVDIRGFHVDIGVMHCLLLSAGSNHQEPRLGVSLVCRYEGLSVRFHSVQNGSIEDVRKAPRPQVKAVVRQLPTCKAITGTLGMPTEGPWCTQFAPASDVDQAPRSQPA